jgi:hypothetical protein
LRGWGAGLGGRDLDVRSTEMTASGVRLSDLAMNFRLPIAISGKILTLAGGVDTVRRFREYPERAVFKRLWLQGLLFRDAPALYGYKRFTAGFAWMVEGGR